MEKLRRMVRAEFNTMDKLADAIMLIYQEGHILKKPLLRSLLKKERAHSGGVRVNHRRMRQDRRALASAMSGWSQISSSPWSTLGSSRGGTSEGTPVPWTSKRRFSICSFEASQAGHVPRRADAHPLEGKVRDCGKRRHGVGYGRHIFSSVSRGEIGRAHGRPKRGREYPVINPKTSKNLTTISPRTRTHGAGVVQTNGRGIRPGDIYIHDTGIGSLRTPGRRTSLDAASASTGKCEHAREYGAGGSGEHVQKVLWAHHLHSAVGLGQIRQFNELRNRKGCGDSIDSCMREDWPGFTST